MPLPIREQTLESTREVRVTRVQSDDDDKIIDAFINFDLKHCDLYNSIDRCWVYVEVDRAQRDQLSQVTRDWQECKVRIEVAPNSAGKATMHIRGVQIAGIWVEPKTR